MQDQMTLDAAKKGYGRKKIENLNDPKYKGMDKMELVGKSKHTNRNSTVHYVRDPLTGELHDFKFTNHFY
ncbi:hypothetical protein [Allofrancisella guangzhouensis]|uniref:hypothetical protein n=1 Tax=Allofrancisella guangzhouensis TaxID=594679 RepID=UPI001907C6DA|nr:hypothetical protein [Allofrancisella guangzhouensis]